MAELKISSAFFESANELPKDVKNKLLKVFDLLTNNPRHPSLQLKKIKGSVRDDIYECRIDLFWRLILQDLGNMLYQAIYVGAHDKAINHGEMLRENSAIYEMNGAVFNNCIQAYLNGDTLALSFNPISIKELGIALQIGNEQP